MSCLFNGGVKMFYTRPSDGRTYCFDPVPLLGESKEFLKTPAGDEIAIIHRLTFNGTLLPVRPALSGVPDQSTCISLLDRKRDQLCNALEEDRGDLLIVDQSGYPIIVAKPLVISIDFEEGIIVQQSPYTVVFEFEQPLGSGFIREFSDNWNFTQQDDDTIEVTHTVNAVGIPKVDENKTAVDTAKEFVLPRLGLDKSQSSVMNTPFVSALIDIDALTGFNRTFTETVDLTAGSYDVSESFVLASGGFNDDRTIERSFELDERGVLIETISINGTVIGRGLDTFARITSAKNGFNSFVVPQIDFNVTSGVLSKTLSENRIAGTVTYSMTLGPSGVEDQLTGRSISRTFERNDDGSVVQTVTTSAAVRLESTSGIETAINFCFANNFPINSAIPIFSITQSGNLITLTSQRDELAKSFSLTRAFVDQTTAFYTETFSLDLQEALDTSVVQITINGTIQGVGDESSTKSTDRFVSASGAFTTTVEKLIAGRIASILPTGACISDFPVQKTLGHSPLAGAFTYSQTFESRFKTANVNILVENIEITLTLQGDVIAVIPVPGKTDGPILQDQETKTGLQKTIGITYTISRNASGCMNTLNSSNDALTIGRAESDVLVNNTPTANPRGERPESSKVFKTEDGINFNRTTYEFTRNVTWQYLLL